jgi:hypothetical protein
VRTAAHGTKDRCRAHAAQAHDHHGVTGFTCTATYFIAHARRGGRESERIRAISNMLFDLLLHRQ